jgi:hypothetical protein
MLLYSDPTGRKICEPYQMLDTASHRAHPGGVLIDRTGTIIHTWASSFNIGADMTEVSTRPAAYSRFASGYSSGGEAAESCGLERGRWGSWYFR